MVGIIIWLIIGGMSGWLASRNKRADGQHGVMFNIIVGIVGAMIGGSIAISSDSGPSIMGGGTMAPKAWIFSLLGAVILVAIINLVKIRVGIILMALGFILSSILFTFVSSTQLLGIQCYHFGEITLSTNCINPQVYRGAWVLAAAVVGLGGWIELRMRR